MQVGEIVSTGDKVLLYHEMHYFSSHGMTQTRRWTRLSIYSWEAIKPDNPLIPNTGSHFVPISLANLIRHPLGSSNQKSFIIKIGEINYLPSKGR